MQAMQFSALPWLAAKHRTNVVSAPWQGSADVQLMGLQESLFRQLVMLISSSWQPPQTGQAAAKLQSTASISSQESPWFCGMCLSRHKLQAWVFPVLSMHDLSDSPSSAHGSLAAGKLMGSVEFVELDAAGESRGGLATRMVEIRTTATRTRRRTNHLHRFGWASSGIEGPMRGPSSNRVDSTSRGGTTSSASTSGSSGRCCCCCCCRGGGGGADAVP
jgi:hypothetical protein